MELNICGDRLVSDPTAEDVREAVMALDAKRGEGFVILGKTADTYIQCSGDQATGYVLEYQENDLCQHYLAGRVDLTFGDIVRALISYLHETEDWKSISVWDPLSLGPG